jgi:hypothetical protein
MKRLFHVCFSAHDEVMFRCRQDKWTFENCLALAIFSTDSELYGDSLMSNHVHIAVLTEDVQRFVRNVRARYSKYFNNKYGRSGRLGEKVAFCCEVKGQRHILAVLSYIFRNGIHHGQCSFPYEHEDSTVGHIYNKEFGRRCIYRKHITSRSEIMTYLPRYSEFPDNYEMDENGMFTRESITQIRKVEMQFVSPWSFHFFMRRPSDDKWIEEQNKDENGREAITLKTIEYNTDITSLDDMLRNEKYVRVERFSDEDVCKIIDEQYVPKFDKKSVYFLDDAQKMKIARDLRYDHHVPLVQSCRCLVMKPFVEE